MGNIDFRNYKS